jgi:DNA-nicking Smr family endonuclease
MDFGDVLNEWERMKRERARAQRSREDIPDPVPESARRSAFEAWLDEHEVDDKDAETAPSGSEAHAEREERDRRLAAMQPQATVDLHGMTARDAESAILAFLEDSGRRGLEKVLIVHGKGNHSKEGPVLGQVARRAVEKSPWAGRSGRAERTEGGSGALWVAVRKKI